MEWRKNQGNGGGPLNRAWSISQAGVGSVDCFCSAGILPAVCGNCDDAICRRDAGATTPGPPATAANPPHSGPEEIPDKTHARSARPEPPGSAVLIKSSRWSQTSAGAVPWPGPIVHPTESERANACVRKILAGRQGPAWKVRTKMRRPPHSIPKNDRETSTSAAYTLSRRESCPSRADFQPREFPFGNRRRPQQAQAGKKDR
jgi:hypothetical protein